ncbi:hypothetical protein [Legionella shakespearei]|uniref:Coiled-coil-containing protein n=1 Tax=Legionella shakespearei DSM 23087 TaxID=1122169 RepID=A0A0W0Z617_9GAMM|nr:hypothetical protein [Legionella shakespearei]KTD64578.1 coiled-coil-containing protein [Legionella shakespearei DSM 23087]
MSKISDTKFTQAIHELTTALSSMVKINKKPVTKENAEKVIDLLNNYETTLAALNERELTKKQKEKLKTVETRDVQEMRESLKRQAEPLVAEINAHEEQLAADAEAKEAAIAEAEEKLEDLFDAAYEAGQKFLQATLATMDDDIVEFNKARTELRNALSVLPQAQRQEAFARFNDECQEALKHKQALEKKVDDAKRVINKSIDNAAAKVSRWKVKEFLKNLLVSYEQPAALEGPDAKLLNESNALVLADLPLKAQNALIKVIVGEIMNSVPQSGNDVLVQMLNQVVANLDDILSGKKSVLAVGYTVNNLLQVMLVNAAKIASNPRHTIEQMILAAYKQGADNKALYLGVVSVAEAGALLQAQGTNIRALSDVHSVSDAFGQIIQSASNSGDLQLSPVDMIILGGGNPQPFTPSQLIDLLLAIAIMLEAREELLELVGDNRLELDPADAANGIGFNPQATLPGAAARLALADKGADEKHNKALYKKLVEFCNLANDLEVKCLSAADAYSEEDKRSISLAATKMSQALKASCASFWNSQDNMKAGFEKFVTDCNTILNSDEANTLKNHPGVWFNINPIIRGLIGVLATILVIPALIVAATSTHGYTGTFFTTPKSTVEVALDNMKATLDEKIDEVKAIASPAA